MTEYRVKNIMFNKLIITWLERDWITTKEYNKLLGLLARDLEEDSNE